MINKFEYPNISDNSIRARYIDFIKQHGPFAYFFTITFPKRQTDDACTQQINQLLYLLNNKIYGKRNTTEYLTGFCFYEKHGLSANNLVHCHGIIKHDPKLDPDCKQSFPDHFWMLINNKKIRIVRNHIVTDEPAFGPNCCDIQRIYNENTLIEYLTKTITERFDFNYFKPIGKHGI